MTDVARGMVIMGRLLSVSQINELAAQAQAKLAVVPAPVSSDDKGRRIVASVPPSASVAARSSSDACVPYSVASRSRTCTRPNFVPSDASAASPAPVSRTCRTRSSPTRHALFH